MPRVALVYPYFRTRSPTELLLPPLGCALLKGQLSARGIESRIFDCTFTTLRALHASLRSYAPDIVGIYSMISLSRAAFAIAEAVREILPASILVAGGPLPTLYPERFSRSFDAVFRGEADLGFPEFCAAVFSRGVSRRGLPGLSLEGCEGLSISNGGSSVDVPPASHTEEERDAFPLPDRSDFDHASYQRAWLRTDGTRTSSLMTSFGCPYECDFCSKPSSAAAFVDAASSASSRRSISSGTSAMTSCGSATTASA
jgi:anaerobic magnesium-protoporphyrin IX monomethyl ester cyclase